MSHMKRVTDNPRHMQDKTLVLYSTCLKIRTFPAFPSSYETHIVRCEFHTAGYIQSWFCSFLPNTRWVSVLGTVICMVQLVKTTWEITCRFVLHPECRTSVIHGIFLRRYSVYRTTKNCLGIRFTLYILSFQIDTLHYGEVDDADLYHENKDEQKISNRNFISSPSIFTFLPSSRCRILIYNQSARYFQEHYPLKVSNFR